MTTRGSCKCCLQRDSTACSSSSMEIDMVVQSLLIYMDAIPIRVLCVCSEVHCLQLATLLQVSIRVFNPQILLQMCPVHLTIIRSVLLVWTEKEFLITHRNYYYYYLQCVNCAFPCSTLLSSYLSLKGKLNMFQWPLHFFLPLPLWPLLTSFFPLGEQGFSF